MSDIPNDPHDFADHIDRESLKIPDNLRALISELLPDIAPHIERAEVMESLLDDWRRHEAELKKQAEARWHDLRHFMLSWSLQLRPKEEHDRIAIVFHGQPDTSGFNTIDIIDALLPESLRPVPGL